MPMVIQAEASFHANHEEGMGGAKENIDEEKKEVLLIVEPNAVVDPGTVMVHLGDASLTDRAMVALWRLYCHALLASLRKDLLYEFDLLVIYL